MRNRCIPVRLSKNKRTDNYYDEINKASKNFSAIGLKWIMEKTPESTKQLLSAISDIKKELVEVHGLESDLAEIYSIPLAAFLTIRADGNFYDWVVKEAKREKLEKKETDVINRFFDDVEGLCSKKDIGRAHISQDGDEIYIWFNEVYRLWKGTFKGTGETPFTKQAILDYLKEEKYWIEPEKDHRGDPKTQKKLDGVNRRCIILDYNTAPEAVKAIVDGYL